MKKQPRRVYRYNHENILGIYTMLFFTEQKIPTNKEVGEKLGLSEMTVCRHLQGIHLFDIFEATTAKVFFDEAVFNKVVMGYIGSRRHSLDKLRFGYPRQDKSKDMPRPLTDDEVRQFYGQKWSAWRQTTAP